MKILMFLLLLSTMALGQPSAPEARVTGVLETPKMSLALVSGAKATFLVRLGDTLGDYKIAKIDLDSVTFTYQKGSWKLSIGKGANAPDWLPLTSKAQTPLSPADKVNLCVQGVERVYVLKMLAAGLEMSVWIDPLLEGTVDVKVTGGSLHGLLDCLAASSKLRIFNRDDILQIVSEATRPLTIPGLNTMSGKVNLDFVNADFVYVLSVLAKEAGRSVVVAPQVEGSVTITTVKALPVQQLTQLIIAGQETAYQASAQGPFLVVGPRLPAFKSALTGPVVSYQSTSFEKPAKVTELVKLLASKLNLKLVAAPDFGGKTMFCTLNKAPALAALERILAVNGYSCSVVKQELHIKTL